MDSIINEEAITNARKIGDKKFGHLSQEQYRQIRIRAKYDLFFLCYGLLGYDKLSENLHGDLCSWLHKTKNEQFREVLLPRSHYKSTVATIGDSIQIALPDDLGNEIYPRNLGPNVRIFLSHEVAATAELFLYSITQHFTVNPALTFFFPECIPNPRIQRINKSELSLPRSAIWSESTFTAFGVGNAAQGKHGNHIKCDDLYGMAARDSKSERESTIRWIDNLQSLLVTPKTDHIDFIGTRWAFDDSYDHIHKVYGDKLHKYIRGCEEPDENGVKKPIFPEEFTPESLAILKKNRKVWNAQYANNPIEGGTKFDPTWIRFYNWVGSRKIAVFNGEEQTQIDIGDLDKIILIDPAMNGKAGYIITGTDWKNRNYVLEAEKKEWRPNELVDKVFSDVIKWGPRLVAIEAVLFSELFIHWFHREMSARGIRFKIVPVRTKQKAKEVRVDGLSNFFAAGQIYFHEGQSDLIQEFYEFGATDDYHMLDALAYGPELWKRGESFNKQYSSESLLDSMRGRDHLTGYSKI